MSMNFRHHSQLPADEKCYLQKRPCLLDRASNPPCLAFMLCLKCELATWAEENGKSDLQVPLILDLTACCWRLVRLYSLATMSFDVSSSILCNVSSEPSLTSRSSNCLINQHQWICWLIVEVSQTYKRSPPTRFRQTIY